MSGTAQEFSTEAAPGDTAAVVDPRLPGSAAVDGDVCDAGPESSNTVDAAETASDIFPQFLLACSVDGKDAMSGL